MSLRGDADVYIPVSSRRAIHGAPRPAPGHLKEAPRHHRRARSQRRHQESEPIITPRAADFSSHEIRRSRIRGTSSGKSCDFSLYRLAEKARLTAPLRDHASGGRRVAAGEREGGSRRTSSGCSGAGRGATSELRCMPLRVRTVDGGTGRPADVPARGVARHGWRASSPQGCALRRPREGPSAGRPVLGS